MADVFVGRIGFEEVGGQCSNDSLQPVCQCWNIWPLSVTLEQLLSPDEDECSLGTAGCSDVSLCVNTDDGYMCVCPTGQMLDNDGKTCLREMSYTYDLFVPSPPPTITSPRL